MVLSLEKIVWRAQSGVEFRGVDLMWKFFVLCVPLVAPIGSFAQSEGEIEFYKFQYQGWSGIRARCEAKNQDENLAICQEFGSHAKMVAELYDIPFIFVGFDNTFFATTKSDAANMPNPLDLTLEIQSVMGNQISGYQFQITFSSFYANAVEMYAGEGEPESSPKAGTLIIDERSAIGTSDTNTLGLKDEMVDAAKSHVGDLLQQYYKYRTP